MSSLTSQDSTGNAGNIIINAGTLRIAKGAVITTSTLGAGKSGNITVRAQSVEIIGSSVFPSSFSSEIFSFPSSLSSDTFSVSTGNAGNITIDAGTLRVAGGASVSTRTFSAGNGGDLTVQAQSVEITGSDVNGSPSSLGSQAVSESTGNAGNLTIRTGTLRLADGGIVSTSTSGAGNGGDLTVWAQLVDVIGFVPVNGSPSSLTAEADRGSTGDAGVISLTIDRLNITNQGQIRTTSLGVGSAGNITAQAGSQITLTDAASINSNTNARQGDITLTTPLLLMRRNSSITTNASGDVMGGNITINVNNGFLVTVPNENNDITANAFNGRGGNVVINTAGIYGFTSRSRTDLERSLGTTDPTKLDPRLLPSNDITAISQGGPSLSGTVAITTPDVDPSRGTRALPTGVVDLNALVANSCVARQSRQGRFVITGTGGLATQPDDLANATFPTYELVPNAPNARSSSSSPAIPEANNFYRLPTGEIVLGRSCQ